MATLSPPDHSTYPPPSSSPSSNTLIENYTDDPTTTQAGNDTKKPASLNLSQGGMSEETARAESKVKEPEAGVHVKLSQKRKWMLLFVFSAAQYLDIALYSSGLILTDSIQQDLGILYESSSWVITAYTVTFASFLLLWGRVSDLYSPKAVFAYGFLLLGLFSLVLSFMASQYAFFVFRALMGICGAATIPSAYRLIVAIFEPQELNIALTMFMMSGPMAVCSAMIIAAVFEFVTVSNQLAGWRWFFRSISLVVAPFGIFALKAIPSEAGRLDNQKLDRKDRLKRLDVVGCALMLSGIILFVLGLTLGSSFGWRKPGFLVPFLLSWLIFVSFFFWEARLPEGYALIPPHFWKLRNTALIIFCSLAIYPLWAVTQLVFIERSLTVWDELAIVAAVRMLPSSIMAIIVALVLPRILKNVRNLRWPMVFGLGISGLLIIPMIYSEGKIFHNAYWRWLFPAFIVGSSANTVFFLCANVAIMTSVDKEMGGVAGALFQVALQVGTVIGLSVQAGFLTLHPGNVSNWDNVSVSFWFVVGWQLLAALLTAVFYRQPKKDEKDEESGETAVMAH
ncbi:hypothetical protein L202_03117 [Cryptococcus amylolentus CBS 6039]|uniref:Major facilitator superfamily (MFS) profile domain-containing protein n=1 Tax=Cryptococcus amylolentus CBS 6039 TaxID=1295533 RepID=A0A1E3HZ48_9TREE|nr:hypothetical protein L202_03117 [Cryptococcus amylolentus CBS 6039]ODN81016.1 hypothetical protein L202_03117 [Cryptococcus amylolentus CBS 6039]